MASIMFLLQNLYSVHSIFIKTCSSCSIYDQYMIYGQPRFRHLLIATFHLTMRRCFSPNNVIHLLQKSYIPCNQTLSSTHFHISGATAVSLVISLFVLPDLILLFRTVNYITLCETIQGQPILNWSGKISKITALFNLHTLLRTCWGLSCSFIPIRSYLNTQGGPQRHMAVA